MRKQKLRNSTAYISAFDVLAGNGRRSEITNEIKLTREEERAIDQKLGHDFKKRMNEFADKLGDLMLEFPMVQGHCKEADYLRQPFMMLSGALHLVKRFGMTDDERDKDDELISGIPAVLDALANMFNSEEAETDNRKGEAK